MNTKDHMNQYGNRLVFVRSLVKKELLIGLFFLMFILGVTTGISYQSYNDLRVVQIVLLLGLCIGSWFAQRYVFVMFDIVFLSFVVVGSFFWQQPQFMIVELLLVYLMYKAFQLLTYQQSIAKLVVLLSLSMFLLLPLSIWDYINTGVYRPNWYPLSLNIRAYDSYFLITSIFATWFYLTEVRYRYFYLLFIFLAFLAVLLDGGRSVTIAYTVFITVVSIVYRSIRWHLVLTYMASCSSYLLINYNAISSHSSGLRILRTATYERLDLLRNAYQCWLQSPIIGCGFYQLDNYSNIAAHPHNLYLQVLSETGLIGFCFLLYTAVIIIKRINWYQRDSYFVIAALMAIGIDSAFSGVYIYPITQMAMLWLLVFLLKHPNFAHARYFNRTQISQTAMQKYLSLVIYLFITLMFYYVFMNTAALIDPTMSIPPRFWINGYHLF